MSAPRRGEIWITDLDPTVGHEQAGRRPVLVLSVDSFNASAAELITVLPLTSRARPNNPFRIAVHPPEGGLSLASYVIAEQPRTISARRLRKPLGAVAPATLSRVADVVRLLLGL